MIQGFVWRVDYQRKNEQPSQTRSIMVVADTFERAGDLIREAMPDAMILSFYTMSVRDVICEDKHDY